MSVFDAVGQLIAEARDSPKCFKCGESITQFNEVRIVAVRVDGKPVSKWAHAVCAKPGDQPRHRPGA
jgi:hypothetical protein